MFSKRVAFSAVVIGAVLVACTSRGGGPAFVPQGNTVTIPAFDSQLLITANLPARTVGEELPSAGLGTIKSTYWKAVLGGYTQTRYSQSLGFPTGTKITLRNLSKKTPHTLNVVAKISRPPAKFPKNPALKTLPHGNGVLETGYASGVIQPGKAVTITLSQPGIYLIGCAYHYGQGMHDVFVVGPKAKPGQQATPPPKSTSKPSASPSTGPSPTGYGGY